MLRRASLGFDLAAVGLWIAFLGYLVVRSSACGWDLHVYQQAAQALVSGRDPFEDPYPVHVGAVKAYLPFIYPPLTLWPLLFLVPLSKAVGYFVWLAIDLVVFGLLLRVWRRTFVEFPLNGTWGLFLLFAFNASAYTCFATGNVALFEALLLFLAMEALLKKRDFQCAGWIVLAACFKVLPILYLALLLWQGGKNKARAAMYGGLAFVLYCAANVAIYPRQTMEFIQAAQGRADNRSNNPSLLAYLDDLCIRAPFLNSTYLYLLIVAVVLGISFMAPRRWKEPDPATKLLFILLVISIILPRFMIYSYIQVIPAAWIAIKELRGFARVAIVAGVCIVLPGSYLMLSRPTWSGTWERALGMQAGVWGYASLYGAFIIWIVFLERIVRTPNLNKIGS